MDGECGGDEKGLDDGPNVGDGTGSNDGDGRAGIIMGDDKGTMDATIGVPLLGPSAGDAAGDAIGDGDALGCFCSTTGDDVGGAPAAGVAG